MTLQKTFILGLLLMFNVTLLGQKKSAHIFGLYKNTKENPWPGTEDEKRNVVWSISINKDSSFIYNYIYDKQAYVKVGQGKWTLKDSVIHLRFYTKGCDILKWGKHKISEPYMDDQAQELVYEYDEYIIRDNKLISIPDGKTELRKNVILFVKAK